MPSVEIWLKYFSQETQLKDNSSYFGVFLQLYVSRSWTAVGIRGLQPKLDLNLVSSFMTLGKLFSHSIIWFFYCKIVIIRILTS